MYHMEERDSIILAYRREGLSIREIARRNGMSRKTVRKYLRAFEQAVGDNPDAEAMDTYLQQPVRYDSSKRVRRVMNQQVMEAIDGFMARNRSNAAAGLRKQQMRKIDMWRRLRDQGIEIAYSTVCQYVRALEVAVSAPAKSPAAFIRQEYEPGFRCEFDWGVLTLWIAGVKTKLHMAVFTMSHSNLRRAYLFSREDTLALMEAHRNCFRALGGTPQVMAYDNMRVAVKKFLRQEREHTDALRRMELHYCFTPHFCNPRSGWEKGKVERSVEHIRRRAFAYDVRFGSLEQAQCHLDKVCDRLNREASNMSAQEKKERVQADIAALRPLDHGDMGCFEQRHARVGKYSTITVDGVHYSVPDRLVGREVPIKMYSERIVVLDGRDKVATHVRSRRPGDWRIDLMHYLGTFLRKPAALGRSTAMQQVHPDVAALFRKHFADSPRSFVELLVFTRDNRRTYADILAAADRLYSRGLKRLSSEQLGAEMLACDGNEAANVRQDADTLTPSDPQQNAIEESASQTLDTLSAMIGCGATQQSVNNITV